MCAYSRPNLRHRLRLLPRATITLQFSLRCWQGGTTNHINPSTNVVLFPFFHTLHPGFKVYVADILFFDYLMDGRSLRDDEWHTINVTKPTSEVFEDLQARKLNQSQIQTVSLQPKSLTNPRVTTTLAKVLPGQNSGTKKQREKLLDGESRYQIENS